MKILVVGASGFVGRHLSRHLVRRGHEVEAWSRQTHQMVPGIVHRSVDLLRDPLPPPTGQPWDAAFHLAAHTRPSLSWNRELIFENLAITARVLDHLASEAPGCRVLLASSAHVYAPSQAPHRESDPVEPDGPYGLSKQLCEAWAISFKGSLDIQITRAFNQVGPGMPSGLLLPDLLDRLQSGEPNLEMKGRNDTKDFLDIRDALDAYEGLLSVRAPSGSIWNICSGRPVSVNQFIQAILRIKGVTRSVAFASEEIQHMIGDPNRLCAATNWRPKRSLDESIAFALEGLHG